MGNVVAIIQLILTLAPLLLKLIGIAKEATTETKGLVESLKTSAGPTKQEKKIVNLEIQGIVTDAMESKAKDAGICAPDNLINIAALVSHEIDKRRAEKVATEHECGQGPIQADEGRFEPD